MTKYKNITLIKTDYFLFLIVFVFLFSLIFNSLLGSVSALVLLCCGGVFFVSNLKESLKILLKNKSLLSIPVLAVFSSLWADYSMLALRGGIQLLLTTIFSIIIIYRVERRTLLYCLGLSLFGAMLASLFTSRFALNGITGEYSLIGIFESKNYLATHTAFAVGISLAILFYIANPTKTSRLLGFTLLITSSLVLIKAKSLGAIASVSVSVILMYVIMNYQKISISISLRMLINFLVSFLCVFLIVIIIYSLTHHIFDEFMYSLNKDPTLTGRTYIWDRGIELITKNPILGAGYQSVFVINNSVAEDIWEFASVPSGSGFNFHNIFINIWVELGILGLMLYLAGVFFMVKRIFKSYFTSDPSKVISLYIFLFLFIQSFLEAILFRQFTLIQFLICFAWISFDTTERRVINVA
jgi:exopolysaccharide production protein ExoQ